MEESLRWLIEDSEIAHFISEHPYIALFIFIAYVSIIYFLIFYSITRMFDKKETDVDERHGGWGL